jgi:hypothetical protein
MALWLGDEDLRFYEEGRKECMVDNVGWGGVGGMEYMWID